MLRPNDRLSLFCGLMAVGMGCSDGSGDGLVQIESPVPAIAASVGTGNQSGPSTGERPKSAYETPGTNAETPSPAGERVRNGGDEAPCNAGDSLPYEKKKTGNAGGSAGGSNNTGGGSNNTGGSSNVGGSANVGGGSQGACTPADQCAGCLTNCAGCLCITNNDATTCASYCQ